MSILSRLYQTEYPLINIVMPSACTRLLLSSLFKAILCFFPFTPLYCQNYLLPVYCFTVKQARIIVIRSKIFGDFTLLCSFLALI